MRKSGSCTIIASKFGVQKQKAPFQDESFLGGFLAEPLTTESLINRKQFLQTMIVLCDLQAIKF
jgi:hypothetical protein